MPLEPSSPAPTNDLTQRVKQAIDIGAFKTYLPDLKKVGLEISACCPLHNDSPFLVGRIQERCLGMVFPSSTSERNRCDTKSKIRSKVGSNHAKYQLKRCTTTQHRTRRINTLEHQLPFRDQGVGGSNPLAPTIFQKIIERISVCWRYIRRQRSCSK
jgi:hypothetical protein